MTKFTAKLVTVFNNKGGVGKTTLTFHLAHALAEQGRRTLLIDLDPQCNLTIYAMSMEDIAKIWEPEDPFIEDFASARNAQGAEANLLNETPRSIHYCLKPTEDGTAEIPKLPPPVTINEHLYLLPGRLTLHMFEAKVGERWSGVYTGDPLSIRTATRIRTLALEFSQKLGCEFIILDTSPSLGSLNRTILSLADAFIIPAMPDLFSVYGIRNIGSALAIWKKQYDSIFHFLSDEKRANFPQNFVKFVGYTLYNARKLTGEKSTNDLGLAQAHFHYAAQIPDVINASIGAQNMVNLPWGRLATSIGDNAVIWGHNTFPSMAQKYNLPMWRLPVAHGLDASDKATISGNRGMYEATQENYRSFAMDLIERLEALHD